MTAVVALGLGAALWMWSLELDPHVLAGRLRDAGSAGVLGLLILLVVQCVVSPIPSEPIMVAAGFVYGPRSGFALSWLGVCLGAVLCFVLARRYGRPLAERFVRSERLGALDARLAAQGLAATFLVVLGLRLFAFGSFDVLSYACGLVRFPFPWFLVATLLGAVPKTLAFSYAGAAVGERPGWLDGVILVGSFGVLILVPWLTWRLRARPA